MNCKELNKILDTIKKNKNSLLLAKLEELGIEYRVLDTEEYGYFRVRVNLISNLDNYVFTDIWYSKFDGGFMARDYWQLN